MTYEVFKRNAARVDAPTVAIVPDGRIALNAAIVRIFREARISSVVLLWDERNRRMAIRAAHKNDRNSFQVSFSENRSAVIRAKSFLTHVRWKARQRERLAAVWDQNEQMIEVAFPAEYVGT